MFGGSPFNAASPFGANTGTSQPSGFGGGSTSFTFGQQNQQQQQSGGLFGSTNTSTGGGIFGSNQTSTFGSTANTGTGIFSNQNKGGLFSGTTNNAFGQQPKTGFGGFGSTTQTSTAGGLFGSTNTAQTSSVFGGTSNTGGVFGGATTTGFGANNSSGTVIKFNPVGATDTMNRGGTNTTVSTKLQCITAMKEYEAKSLEELRVEDYLANRKSASAGSTTSGGLFGSTQQPSTGFNFGQAAAAKPTGLATAFGSTSQPSQTGGIFGSTNTGGGLFGMQQNKTGFGTTTTTTASTGLFGSTPANTGGGLFGSTQQKPGGLFGSTTSQPSTGFNFGQQQSTASTGFGFGQPAASSSAFGATQSTGSLFGTNTSTTSAFGSGLLGANKPASTGFSFGTNNNQQAKPGGLFGASTGFGTGTSTGAFGAKPAASGFGSFGGFGTNTSTAGTFNLGATTSTAGGGLFGNQNKAGFNFNTGANTGTGLFGGSTLGNTTNQAAVQQQMAPQGGINAAQLAALINSPYGDSPIFKNVKNSSSEESKQLLPTNPAAQKAALSGSHKVSPATIPKAKPKPLTSATVKSQLFSGLDEEAVYQEELFVPRRNVRQLLLKGRSSLAGSAPSQRSRSPSGGSSAKLRHFSGGTGPQVRQFTADDQRSPDVIKGRKNLLNDSSFQREGPEVPDSSITELLSKEQRQSTTERTSPTSPDTHSVEEGSVLETSPADVLLKRPGYYTIPSLNQLSEYIDEQGNCIVTDFTVGREGYGSIFFKGPVNLRGMNLDEIVHFRRKEVTVYPDDENKPAVGCGLNQPAQVTLDCVWPVDKTDRSPIKDTERIELMKYREKLEAASARMGARFLDYRPETGSWVFQVKHFSKYGLPDDDDEDDPKVVTPDQLKLLKQARNSTEKVQKKDIEKSAVVGKENIADILKPKDCDISAVGEELPEKAGGDMDVDKGHLTSSSHKLASQLNLRPQKVQVMKASYFGLSDSDEEDEPSGRQSALRSHKVDSLIMSSDHVISSPLLKEALQKQQNLIKSMGSEQAVQSDMEWNSLDKKKSGIILPNVQFKAFPEVNRPALEEVPASTISVLKPVVSTDLAPVPLAQSLANNKTDCVLSCGLMFGRQHRVGWCSSLQFADASPKFTASDASVLGIGLLSRAAQTGPRSITVNHLQPWPSVEDSERETEVTRGVFEVLLNHMKFSTETTEQAGPAGVTPRVVPTKSASLLTALRDCVSNVSSNKNDTHWKNVLSLCYVLWGDLEELTSVDSGGYPEQQIRRRAFGSWLRQVVADNVEESLKSVSMIKDIGRRTCAQVFFHLSGGDVASACEAAIAGSHVRLALLIAQSGGTSLLRTQLTQQLESWRQTQADRYISDEALRVYCLLAGQLLWDASDRRINCLDNLDWHRALALTLWYETPEEAPLSNAVQRFGQHSQDGHCVLPLPPYLTGEPDAYLCSESTEVTYSVEFELLQHYQQPGSLNRLFSPHSYTANLLDCRLGWVLLQILISLKHGRPSLAIQSALARDTASVLEAAGLWHLAVLPLLTSPSPHVRAHGLRGLLARHINLDLPTALDDYLKQKLNLPKQWIAEAKATRAGYDGRQLAQAFYLTEADQYNEAHDVIVEHLVHGWVIHDRLEPMLAMLQPLYDHKDQIRHWHDVGQLYWNYLQVHNFLTAFESGELCGEEVESCEQLSVELCNWLSQLPSKCTTEQRLCRAEIGVRCIQLLRVALTHRSNSLEQPLPVAGTLAAVLAELPLPEDCTQTELRSILDAYLLESTS